MKPLQVIGLKLRLNDLFISPIRIKKRSHPTQLKRISLNAATKKSGLHPLPDETVFSARS
jgi:hypothetical protein